MTKGKWDRVKEKFDLLEAIAPAERQQFVEQLRREDPELGSEVARLLDYARHQPSLLDSPAIGLIAPGGLPRGEAGTTVSQASLTTDGPATGDEASPLHSDRFHVLRKVGRGGMGSVYEAYDKVLSAKVAAKVLHRPSSRGIYLFKQEFRSLAHLNHRNLVTLYEFFADGQRWFYTMEFVPGISLVARTAVDGAIVSRPWNQTRELLLQLFEGIAALHAAGKLHRDIKPSNILVTEEDRVVLLDFGLVSDIAISEDTILAGTPSHMSPEQLRGEPLTSASDWYSAGVVLYELLAGRLPPPASARLHSGTAGAELRPPSEFASVPEELDQLCTAMLCLKPDQRPHAAEIFDRLGKPGNWRATAGFPTSAISSRPVLGRDEQLEVLRNAFDTVCRGTGVAVCVVGPLGMGKSALVGHFLSGLPTGRDITVLRGRCYERESVPFNALDSLIDELGRCLKRKTPAQLDELLPPDIQSLCQTFPVLDWLTAHAPRVPLPADQLQLRRRAFLALRELLTRLGRVTQLVLSIDDLHWGDVDSAAALLDLFREPNAPVVLLVLAYRAEAPNRSRCLQILFDESPGTILAGRIEVQLRPLSPESSKSVAESLLVADSPGSTSPLPQMIVSESGGNPYFIGELAAYAATLGRSPEEWFSAGGLSLDFIIGERVSRLPGPARRLLEIVALAGRPIRNVDALDSAVLGEDSLLWLSLLRSNRFVRSAASSSDESLETYHDRVRETILAHIGPDERQSGHASLAETLERSGSADPETLAVHFEGAGKYHKAGAYFESAATQSAAALAFNRAAELYRRALDLSEYGVEDRKRVNLQFAESLANAGRAFEAGRIYQDASDVSTPNGLLCLSRAGYHYAASGHLEHGKKAFAVVLKQLGVRLPLQPAHPLPSLLLVRAMVAMRLYRFRPALPRELRPVDLARVDACWSVGAGLGLIELLTGALFTSYALHLALKAGDPFRIARALTWEAAIQASQSRKGKQEAVRLFSISRSIVDRLQDPYSTAMLSMTEGQACFSHGRWAEALSRFDKAHSLFANQCTGVAFELATLQGFRLQTLVYAGDFTTLRSCTPDLLEEARAARDLYLETFIAGAIQPLLYLADDRPDLARQSIEHAMAAWPAAGYHLQHALIDQIRVCTELYASDGAAAETFISQRWVLLKQSHLLLNQNLRAKLLELRAKCALAASSGNADGARAIERFVTKLEREKEPYFAGSALGVRAVLCRRKGDGDKARSLLTAAAEAFDTWQMRDYAAAVRYTLAEWGQDFNGAEGQSALSWFARQKIINPSRWAKMRLPAS